MEEDYSYDYVVECLDYLINEVRFNYIAHVHIIQLNQD